MSQRTSLASSYRRAVPAAVMSAVWIGSFAGVAGADTYSWGGATGSFSTAANWAGGVAPTGLSATDTLVFDTANAYTATNNIYTTATRRQFDLTNLILNDASPITINSTARIGTATTVPGNISVYTPFRFLGANSLIDQQGAGTATVAAPINVGPGGSLTIRAEAGSGQLILANTTTAAAMQDGFQFQGEGALNFNNLSSNPILVGNMANYIGRINVLAGTVAAADSPNVTIGSVTGTGNGDTISNQTLINVSSGATFDFNRNGETFGSIVGTGTIALGSTGGLTMEYGRSDLAFAGNITQPALGTGGVNKDVGSGHTTYTWTGNSANFGTTTVSAGTMVLSGNGQFSATATLTLANGGTMVLDNTAQNLSGRINPTAVLNPGGTLTILGAPGQTTAETVGSIVIGGTSGEGTINVVNGSGGGTTSLTAGTLSVSTTAGGFVNFTGDGSVLVTTAPALVNGIIGPATVNYADWATVDTNNGNRVVALSTYQTSPDPTTWQSTDNVRVSGTPGGNADAGTSAVNSLALTPGSAVTINSSLTLGSGGLLLTSGVGSVSGGQINSGASNAQFTAAVGPGGTLTVNSNVVDGPAASALVKAGPGTLVLNGSNTFSGGLVVAKGTVQVASDAAMGSGGITLNGGTLQFTVPVSTTKAVSLLGVDSVIDTGANTVSMTGTMGSGNNGSLTKRGSGTLVINLYSTSGDLDVEEGVFQLGSGNIFGNGSKVHIAAGASVDMSFDPSGEDMGMIEGAGELRMYNNAGISMQSGAFDNVTFSGQINAYLNGVPTAGTGGFTKNGVGSLTLSGASNYGGATRIQTGALVITADALPGVNGPLGNATSAVSMGFTPSNSFAEADMVAAAQFYVGAAGVTEGRDISVATGTNAANGTVTGMVTIGATHTSGTSTISGAISMGRATEVYVPGTATQSLTGVISGGGAMSKIGDGTAVLTNTNTFTGGLYVQAGTVVLASAGAAGTGSLNVSGGTLVAQAGLGAPLKPSGVTLSSLGTLDLNDNDAILTYTTTSPLAAIRSAVVAARDGGAWDHAGLTSTSAKNSGGATTIAVAEATDLGATSFDGVSITGPAVLIKYTYYGDLNFDGVVNADDYALLDRGRARGLTGWVNGDVNYDGVVDAADYMLVDTSYGHQNGALSADFLAARAAEFGDGYVSALVAAVPEPGVGGLLVAFGSLLAGARRRRRRA